MNECYIATRNKVFFMNFPEVEKGYPRGAEKRDWREGEKEGESVGNKSFWSRGPS